MLLLCADDGTCRLADGLPLTAAVPGECTVLLPPSWCSITEVAVGPGEAALLRKTLPWRLEETLLVPVESLHFAHGDVVDGRSAVVVVDRLAVEQLRQQLAADGFIMTAAHAPTALLPWQPRQWTLWVDDGDRTLVRYGWHAGFVCDAASLVAALGVLHNEQQEWPQAIVCLGSAERAAVLQAMLPVSLQPLVVVRKPPAWDALVAAGTPVNVMQGALAPPLPWRRWWQHWRAAALVAAALLLADIGITLVERWRLVDGRAIVEQRIADEFRRWQRDGAMVDPVLQLQALLTARGGGSQRLLPLLTRTVPALQSAAVGVQALDYDASSGELQLDVHSSTGFAAIERLRAALQATGLQAELVGSTSDGNASRARLRVLP